MSRFSRDYEPEDVSIEQFRLKFREEVIAERKKRLTREAKGLPPEIVRSRKLSRLEVRHLEKLEEREKLEKELGEAGF